MSNKQEYERRAQHHIAQGKCFKAMGDGHRKLAEMGGDAADVHTSMADACDKAVADHADQATYCMSCMKALAAGAGDATLEKLTPWPASTIPTTDVPIRAYPRAGQPNTPDAIDTSAVPIAFRKLVEFDDEV